MFHVERLGPPATGRDHPGPFCHRKYDKYLTTLHPRAATTTPTRSEIPAAPIAAASAIARAKDRISLLSAERIRVIGFPSPIVE
jgi:hypothetical protein